MSVTERVMSLGDWSLTLTPETPDVLLKQIATPFSQIVITPTRFNPETVTDTVIADTALYAGVVLRPGPQRTLGGCSLAWYLGDDNGGAGVKESASKLYQAHLSLIRARSRSMPSSPVSRTNPISF